MMYLIKFKKTKEKIKMKKIILKVEIEVDEIWIDDGFGSDNIALEETITKVLDENILTYALNQEKKITVKVIKNNTQTKTKTKSDTLDVMFSETMKNAENFLGKWNEQFKLG